MRTLFERQYIVNNISMLNDMLPRITISVYFLSGCKYLGLANAPEWLKVERVMCSTFSLTDVSIHLKMT